MPEPFVSGADEPPEPPKTGAVAQTAAEFFAATMVSVSVGAIAGAMAGLLWGGIGGRLAMRILFLTSSEMVAGLISDDGFEIGRISASTIFLLLTMTLAGGFLGCGYGLARMLMRGPVWLIAVAVAVTLGAAVGGGVIVSADGIDFRFLTPLWLAVGMFVFLPAAWGFTVVVITERLLHHGNLFPEPLPGVDARPLGIVGDVIVWGLMFALTVAGTLDLLQDLERLT